MCTWLVNTCMLYFGKFLSLFFPGDYLAFAYPPSFPPLWAVLLNSDRHNTGPRFLNTGCEKKGNKKEPQKRGGGKKVQIKQILATSCAFTHHLIFKGFFPYP